MSEKKTHPGPPPVFFEDESDEPTIVWVKPPRRLRGFTRQVHFLNRLSQAPPIVELTEEDDKIGEDDKTEEGDKTEEDDKTFEEDTRV